MPLGKRLCLSTGYASPPAKRHPCSAARVHMIGREPDVPPATGLAPKAARAQSGKSRDPQSSLTSHSYLRTLVGTHFLSCCIVVNSAPRSKSVLKSLLGQLGTVWLSAEMTSEAMAIPVIMLECKVCRKQILQEFVTIKGFKYHPEYAIALSVRIDVCSDRYTKNFLCWCHYEILSHAASQAGTRMPSISTLQVFQLCRLHQADFRQFNFCASGRSEYGREGELVRTITDSAVCSCPWLKCHLRHLRRAAENRRVSF